MTHKHHQTTHVCNVGHVVLTAVSDQLHSHLNEFDLYICLLFVFGENQALLGTFNFLSKSSANRLPISPDILD